MTSLTGTLPYHRKLPDYYSHFDRIRSKSLFCLTLTVCRLRSVKVVLATFPATLATFYRVYRGEGRKDSAAEARGFLWQIKSFNSVCCHAIQSLAVNHCENATKIREAILLRENVENSRRFATFRLKSTSNHCENTTKTQSEYSQRDSVVGNFVNYLPFITNSLNVLQADTPALHRLLC